MTRAPGDGAPAIASAAPAPPRREIAGTRRTPRQLREARAVRLLKLAVWVGCLIPLAGLIRDSVTGGLGVNPIEEVTHRTGRWALILLLVTLSVTPVRRITGWNGVVRVRRALGLFAFAYAVLHLLTYVSLDLFFDFRLIADDILRRPYITVGTAAFLLLVPLALTSNRAAIRRLGRRWQTLHLLVYPAAALAVLHFIWLVKSPAIGRPLRYAAVLAALLLVRAVFWLWRRFRGRPRAAPAGRGGQR